MWSQYLPQIPVRLQGQRITRELIKEDYARYCGDREKLYKQLTIDDWYTFNGTIYLPTEQLIQAIGNAGNSYSGQHFED